MDPRTAPRSRKTQSKPLSQHEHPDRPSAPGVKRLGALGTNAKRTAALSKRPYSAWSKRAHGGMFSTLVSRIRCPGQLRGDCSYRFDPRRLPSDKRAELPRLAPSKGFGAPSPATRPPLSPSIQPIRTSLSSGGDAVKYMGRGSGSDLGWDERLAWGCDLNGSSQHIL